MASNQGPWAFKLLSSFKPDHMDLRISCLLMTIKGVHAVLLAYALSLPKSSMDFQWRLLACLLDCLRSLFVMLLQFFSPYSFNLFPSLSICETFGALRQTNSSKDK